MLLEVKNLEAAFTAAGEYIEVLHGVDLSISEDEVVGLVGESGCGKTITAFSIMRLLPRNEITGGKVIFEGKDLLSLSEEDMRDIRGKNIAIVFQEPFTALNPVLRVGEQIKEAVLAHKKVSRKEAKNIVFNLLEKVRIESPERIYNNYPHQLSGGQRQRALIAMSLALEPKLLIADEPTTALDVTTQSEILKLLLELKRSMKMSILFITHDFGIINEVADRVFVMKDGKIVEEGRKSEILNSPKHSYTKKLLEAVPRIKEVEKERPTSRETLVEAIHLSKSFAIERGIFKGTVGKIEAVKDVNLAIKKGQTMGLVGGSGCGKTTLGRLLIRLENPSGGYVEIKGKPLDECLKDTPRSVREMMQIVFQDPYGSLDPRMRVGQIILEGPTILGKSRAEKKAILNDVLTKVHLKPTDARKYPHQFSGGQRQRIAIARALATKAEFLILDEPVSSLDVLIQKDILELLKSLQKGLGLTYLFISHDLRVVEIMSDEIAVMYQGSIVEIASRSDIFKKPKHPYTKHLLSSIPAL